MTTAPGTVGNAVEDAAKRFEDADLAYGHGTSTAYDDAAFLVLETLKQKPDSLKKNWKRKLKKDEQAAIEKVIAARIATRMPSAYIVNRSYIQGLPFFVDERVIVPRSFIGEILFRDDGFQAPGFPTEIKTVLDLCTGSGCLAILAAHIWPKAQVDAVDLSPAALEVAARNVRDHKLQDRVKLHQGDLFAPLADRKYDIIITNPPYVDAEGMTKLPPEFRHEPEMALAAGADGLDLVRKIIEQAPDYMTERSGMICEIGRGQKNLESVFPRMQFLWLDTENSEGEVFWITRKKIEEGRSKK
jgi:ribosomal protein L3 glutamine methyltransferase